MKDNVFQTRVPKDSKEGNEDHLVIRKVVDEQKQDDLDEKVPIVGIPKLYPGDFYKDKFPKKQDPRGEPSVIEFKWNKDFKDISQCDTLHMLYLLQCACELHRKRVIERNKYFKSISRSDRYIEHVDAPQLITNFIKWHEARSFHRKDGRVKEYNVFTGDMLEYKQENETIEMLRAIGEIRNGVAIRIYHKLRKDVVFEYDEWTEHSDTKLKLETWGLTKMHSDEIELEDCTVDDVVTLFTFANDNEQKEMIDGRVAVEKRVNGIFAQIEQSTEKAIIQITHVRGWKRKIVAWIREQEVDGKKIQETQAKHLYRTLRIKLEPKDKRAAKRLNGSCEWMFNTCKEMKVHQVLEAAKSPKWLFTRKLSLRDITNAVINMNRANMMRLRNMKRPDVSIQKTVFAVRWLIEFGEGQSSRDRIRYISHYMNWKDDRRVFDDVGGFLGVGKTTFKYRVTQFDVNKVNKGLVLLDAIIRSDIYWTHERVKKRSETAGILFQWIKSVADSRKSMMAQAFRV